MEELKHFGVLGMKWGIHKTQDEINSRQREIRKGTVIQNITSKQYQSVNRHMYSAYTPYDKASYIDTMGNFQYSEKGYKNEFVVKKSIKIPSDRQLVDIFKKTVEENPKQVAKDMAAAYNALSLFGSRVASQYERKFSSLKTAPQKDADKLAREFVVSFASRKIDKSRSAFFGNLINEGFDAISDLNDREQLAGTQDPLIIFNPKKVLGKVKSVKLTKKDLDYYNRYVMSKDYTKTKGDLSVIQHTK